MRIKVRRSNLKKKRLSGFMTRKKTPAGRRILARRRRLKK